MYTTTEDSRTNSSNFQQLCDKQYDIVWLSLGLIILCGGTVGHILSITVTLASKSMRAQSSAVYISALSLVGLLTLYTGLLRYITIFTDLHAVDFRRGSSLSCRFHTMLTYLSLHLFSWLQATIAVDRVVAVRFPHRYKASVNVRQGLIVVTIETIAAIALCTSIIFQFVDLDDDGFCSNVNDNLANSWYVIDIVSFSVLPAAIIIISNSLILSKLYKGIPSQSTETQAKVHSLNITLVVVNFVFLITTVPISVHFILIVAKQIGTDDVEYCLLFTMFTLTQYLGIGCTFLVYCISSKRFRGKLIYLFKTYLSSKSCHMCSCTKHSKVRPTPN